MKTAAFHSFLPSVHARRTHRARALLQAWLKEHYGENGCQQITQPRSAQRTQPTSEEPEARLRIVPNPASHEMRISVPEGRTPNQMSRKLQILTLNGREIFVAELSMEKTELSVSVKTWPEGMYVVRLLDGAKALVRPFVVQR